MVTTAGITSLAASVISANGGTTSPTGGTIDFQAGGTIDLAMQLSALGSDGGSVSLLAGGDIILRGGVNVNGPGDAGSGGEIGIEAGLDVQILGQLLVRGTDSGTLSGGGDGGFVDISADFGDVTIAEDIFAEGADTRRRRRRDRRHGARQPHVCSRLRSSPCAPTAPTATAATSPWRA